MLYRLQTLPWRAALMPLLAPLLHFFERLRAACIGGIQPYLQIVSEALRPKEARRALVLAAGFLLVVIWAFTLLYLAWRVIAYAFS